MRSSVLPQYMVPNSHSLSLGLTCFCSISSSMLFSFLLPSFRVSCVFISVSISSCNTWIDVIFPLGANVHQMGPWGGGLTNGILLVLKGWIIQTVGLMLALGVGDLIEIINHYSMFHHKDPKITCSKQSTSTCPPPPPPPTLVPSPSNLN